MNYMKLIKYMEELKVLETKFSQHQSFMTLVFEKVVERDQRSQFIDQNAF